jgi:hypothetical protein
MSGRPQQTQLPSSALTTIERWVIQAVPEAEEQERHLTVVFGDREATVYEHLAPSRLDVHQEWIKRPVAQLRYLPHVPVDIAWELYCIDSDDNWYPYEFFNQPGSAFVGTLEEALADIEEDRQGWFFGSF